MRPSSPPQPPPGQRLRALTWSDAATSPKEELLDLMLACRDVKLPPLDTTTWSPRGFVVDARGEPTEVPAGLESPRPLRAHRYVVMDELAWPSPYAAATTVVSLSLAGVPVLTSQLSPVVRAMVDGPLLSMTDRVTADSMRDVDTRECLSISIRRRAHEIYGFRVPADEAHPLVSVIVPEHSAGDPSRMLDDLARQSWPNLHVHRDSAHRPSERLAEELSEVRSVYVTRLQPHLAYGPHHVQDLVHALRHSGASVVGSPPRFGYAMHHGVLLEHPAATGETTALRGRNGTTMWYRLDGIDQPRVDRLYLGHGCNVVSLETPDTLPAHDDRPTAKTRRSLPPALEWLAETTETTTGPASYFARAGSGLPARS